MQAGRSRFGERFRCCASLACFLLPLGRGSKGEGTSPPSPRSYSWGRLRIGSEGRGEALPLGLPPTASWGRVQRGVVEVLLLASHTKISPQSVIWALADW